jgi:hypothetical protein
MTGNKLRTGSRDSARHDTGESRTAMTVSWDPAKVPPPVSRRDAYSHIYDRSARQPGSYHAAADNGRTGGGRGEVSTGKYNPETATTRDRGQGGGLVVRGDTGRKL